MVPPPAVGFLVCCLKIIDAFEKADYVRLLCELYWKTGEFPASVSLDFLRSSIFRNIERRLGFCFMIEIEIIDLQLFELGVEGSPL
jgi:predicted AAA+ superfamily ATPase